VHAVRAPADGRILRLHRDSEGAVAAGAPLLELADTDRLEVVAELLTADTARIAPGLPAWVEAGGGPPVAGRVRQVEPAAFTKVSALGVEEQRVNVIVDLPSPSPSPSPSPLGPPDARATGPAPWGDGWRVTVRIVTRHVDDALVVPVSAVFPWVGPAVDTGALSAAPVRSDPGTVPAHMGVFVVEAGRARLRPVMIGDRNVSHAWVVGGLASGARVIVYPGAELADGQRVREREGE
jgi:HlyD family secretion protein